MIAAMRVDSLKHAAADQRIERGRDVRTALGTGEQPVLASDHRLAKHQLGQSVVHGHFAMLEMCCERVLLPNRVGQRLSEEALGTRHGGNATGPREEPVDDGLGDRLSMRSNEVWRAAPQLSLDDKQVTEGAQRDVCFGRVGVTRFEEAFA